jgi:FKBP-type peptidyl-prolyl cis-trans isomerase
MRIRSIAFAVAAGGVAALLFAAEPASQPAKTETKAGGLKITYVAPPVGAKDGDEVSILYAGRLADGTEFDSSAKHGNEPIPLVLGKHMVIQGWEDGLQGMQVGEKRTFVIPPELAYGKDGRGPIPPNATLTFDVEMVSLRRPANPAAQ